MVTAAIIILLLALSDHVSARWRDAISGFVNISDQYPFIPRFDQFVTSEDNVLDYSDQDCNAFQLRTCLLQHKNFDVLRDGLEDDDQQFEQTCKISAYVRGCLAAAQCSSVESLWDVGLDRQQAAMIISAAHIEQIRCADLRFGANHRCISEVLTDARKEFRECAVGFEKLSWLKGNSGKACKAIRHYGSCVQQIVRNRCGTAAADSVCLIVEAVVRELHFSDNCDLDCSSSQNNVIGFTQSILPDYQNPSLDGCNHNTNCDCGRCELDSFKCCSEGFKKELGIKGGGCVFEFLDELKNIMYKKGQKGFEAVCNAGKHFKSCGDDKVCGCFNVDVLQKKMNMTAAEAWALNFTVFALEYECTHKEFGDDFDCLRDTTIHKKEVLDKCGKRLREELKKPGRGIPCKAGQHYMDCISSPFKRACGLKAAKAVCNLELALLHEYGIHMRSCPFHCDI